MKCVVFWYGQFSGIIWGKYSLHLGENYNGNKEGNITHTTQNEKPDLTVLYLFYCFW